MKLRVAVRMAATRGKIILADIGAGVGTFLPQSIYKPSLAKGKGALLIK